MFSAITVKKEFLDTLTKFFNIKTMKKENFVPAAKINLAQIWHKGIFAVSGNCRKSLIITKRRGGRAA